MYNLTVKVSDGAGSQYPTTPPPVKNEGFRCKGVKYRFASKNKINPYLIILFDFFL